MKKSLALLMTVALLLAMTVIAAVPTAVSAKFYDDFRYEILSDGTVEITDCSKSQISVTIPATIEGRAVTSIGAAAFASCKSLESVTIPDSVETIGERAFYYCSSLKSITIPDSVTTIGAYAFFRCASLESITIPDSVTTIGEWAFAGCTSLESITIPDLVTTIGEGAFSHCESLESITIPDSVTLISEGAFSNCNALQTVYYDGSDDDWNRIVIASGNDPLISAERERKRVVTAVTGEDPIWLWITVGVAAAAVVVVVVIVLMLRKKKKAKTIPAPQAVATPHEQAAPQADGVIYCPQCGHRNAHTQTFCEECGAKLES